MPFSTAESTRVLQIFGIPLDGVGIAVEAMTYDPPTLARMCEPLYITNDFSHLLTLVNAKLAAATAAQVTNVQALIVRWEAIEASPMKLNKTGEGESGVVVDDEKEMDLIRWNMGQILGISIPQGGFMAAADRHRAAKDPSQPGNFSWGSGLGDR